MENIADCITSPGERKSGRLNFLEKLYQDADDWYDKTIAPNMDEFEARRLIWDYSSTEPQCNHKNKRIVYKLSSIGRKMFRWQCPDCQSFLSEWVKVVSDKGIPEQQERDWSSESHYRVKITEKLIERHKKEKSSSFWNWYNNYLRSPEWAAKRNAILRRANGKCEGCGDRPPTAVHHLSYAHVGNELLFELAALCTPCHKKAHEKRGK